MPEHGTTESMEPSDDSLMFRSDRPDVYQGKEGDTVAGYRLVRMIGKGGMGEVWDAQHERHGGRVAIKIIFQTTYDEQDSGAIAREFKVLLHMRHEHIVRVWDAGIHEGGDGRSVPFIVMDYIQGAQTITAYAAQRQLNARDRLRLFQQVADAVAYVHEHGDLHLDLKPDNILIDKHGRVFLTDFGIARPALGWSASRVAGTPGFMAPEHLARNVDQIDKRTDVWALGAMLYSLLTNADPYGLPRDATVRDRISAVQASPRRLTDAVPAIRDEAPDLLPDLEAVIQKSMAPDPDHRYANAGELAEALREAEAVQGLGKHMASIKSSRPRFWALMLALVITAISTGLGFVITQPAMAVWRGPVDWFAGTLPTHRRSVGLLESLPDVAIVEFGTQTAAALRDEDGLDMLKPAIRKTYRPMHAQLLRKLAVAGARVVVLDLHFPSEGEHDELLGQAIRDARQQGVGVVVGSKTWAWQDGRSLGVTPAIWAEGPLWGGLHVGVDQAVVNYWTYLVVERDGIDPMPSLSTAAFAAYQVPDAHHDYQVVNGSVHVRHFTLAERAEHRIYRTESHWLEPSSSTIVQTDDTTWPDDKRHGFLPGDTKWFRVLRLASPEAIAGASIDYADAWGMPSDDLRRRIEGKVVVVRDVELDGAVHPSDTLGALVHIAAIQSLILQHSAKIAGWWNVPLTALGALLACLVVWCGHCLMVRRTGDRRGRWRMAVRVVCVVAAVLVAASVLVIIAWCARFLHGTLLYPIPGITAAVVASILACWTAKSSQPLLLATQRQPAGTNRSSDLF